VLVQDENGAPIAGAAVTLSLATNPGGATLHGGAATTGSDGIATFGQLWLDRLGSGYRLRATTGARVSADRGPFDGVPLVVSTGADAGAGSLRVAIESANRNAGYPDTISFDIDGGGVHTIAPAAPLPSVTDALTIDGTTQPGYAGTPVIELNGLSAGNTPGLVITGGGSTVRGLAISGFSFDAIRLAGGSGNVIQGNFIGTDATGASARPNNEGIFVAGSSNNRIGGTSVAERNVISGNLATGINISSSLATGNESGHFIDGRHRDRCLGNGQFGVFISDASGNTSAGRRAERPHLATARAASFSSCLEPRANSSKPIGTTVNGTAALGNGGRHRGLLAVEHHRRKHHRGPQCHLCNGGDGVS
jgi:hypothetical protein